MPTFPEIVRLYILFLQRPQTCTELNSIYRQKLTYACTNKDKFHMTSSFRSEDFHYGQTNKNAVAITVEDNVLCKILRRCDTRSLKAEFRKMVSYFC